MLRLSAAENHKRPMAQPKAAPRSDLVDLLHRAAGLHQSGALDQAEQLYRQVLDWQPANFDALQLCGLLLRQRGRLDEALDLLTRAVQADPRQAGALYNQGVVLAALARHADALASYDRALALKPDYFEAVLNRGNTLHALARHDDALAAFDTALHLRPNFPDALVSRGRALLSLKRDDEALASLERALALAPNDVRTHANRGFILRGLQRFDDALAAYAQALGVKPDYIDAIVSRGDIFYQLHRYGDAVAEYDRALAILPDATRHEGNAHTLAPYASAAVNRGVALRYLDHPQEALASFERAQALAPNMPEAPYNKALVQLSNGDFANGWAGYEWRWRGAPELKPRNFAQPQWRGEAIAGKTILLHAEQGYGDSIQFLRYVPLVKAGGARIILELPNSLRPLLGELADGIEVVSPGSALPPFDIHCPLMSLALAFATTLETIPTTVPYLSVPEARREHWRACLPRDERRRVGLVWSGRPTHMNDHNRSIPLAGLAPLLSIPGVSFVSLQRDYREIDVADLGRFPIRRLDDALTDFADTAAVIEQLDLVITVDTAVAHLAGALAKPVWIMLPRVPDWRWLLAREDSPWYPTARLFRQAHIGDWRSVIENVADMLAGTAPKIP